MSLKKTILPIALILSFHTIVISMQEEAIYEQKTRIAQFIQDHNLEHIKLVGNWLTTKRSTITNDEEWKIIINWITSVGSCRCNCLSKEITNPIKDVIKQVAHNLQPGQDCSQLLVERAKDTIEKTTQEWNEEKINNDLHTLCIK